MTDLTMGSLTRSPSGSGRLLRSSGTGKRWRRRTAARPRNGLADALCLACDSVGYSAAKRCPHAARPRRPYSGVS